MQQGATEDPSGGVSLPPVLYIPTSGSNSEGEALIDFRITNDNRTALLVYTALDRLITCCGQAQSWILLQSSALDQIMIEQPFDVLYIDLLIPPEHRKESVIDE